jgi:hypothetical protein
MNINEIRTYFVKINNGSGCLFRPLDNRFTYILVARHVIGKPNKEETEWSNEQIISIDRFELIDDDYNSLKIYLDDDKRSNDLKLGDNYFPHRSKDIAIIKINRLPKLDQLVNDDLSKKIGPELSGYFMCGYPGTRDRDKNKKSRLDPGIEILDYSGDGLREAKHPMAIEQSDVEGFSGGGVLKYDGDNIFLAGIIKRIQDKEPLGRFHFYPLHNFNEIVEQYPGKLEPLFKNISSRTVISININDSFQDDKVKKDLIDLLRDNSKGLIVDPNARGEAWEYFLNECNEEVFRELNDGLIISNKKGIITSIGTSLFLILNRDENHKKNMTQLIESPDPKSLQLDFTYSRHNNKRLNYSSIPWEYLFCPEDLAKNRQSYPIIKDTLITRSIGPMNGALHARLEKIKIVVVAEEDFILHTEEGSEVKISEAIKKLGNESTNEFLNFTFLETKSITLSDLQDKLFRNMPNIIHLLGSASWSKENRPDLFIKKEEAINLEKNDVLRENLQLAAENQLSENRLLLCILQTTFSHPVEQYRALDGIATVMLRNKIPSVISIPHCLGRQADFFLLKSFYNDIAQGKNIGESFFSLSNKIRQKGAIGFPVLYSNHRTISITKEEDTGGGGKSTDERSAGNISPNNQDLATDNQSYQKKSIGYVQNDSHI